MSVWLFICLFFAFAVSEQTYEYDLDSGKELLNLFKEIYESDEMYKASNIPYYGAIPSLVGEIKNGIPFSYQDNHFSYKFSASLSGNNVVVKYTTKHTQDKKGCMWLFFLPERVVAHEFFFQVSSSLKFKNLTPSELAYFKTTGIRAYRLPYGIKDMLFDIKRLGKMFSSALTGKYTNFSIQENLAFLKQVANVTLVPRKVSNTTFPITAKDVHSGDVFGSVKPDGLGTLIMAVTGSKVSHLQIALEIKGVMHVCEAQASSLWPVKGLQCNKFEDFVEYTKAEPNPNVVWMRLASPYRERFNATRAYQYMSSLLGTPYGFESFIFSAMDSPADNLFYPLDEGSLDLIYYFIDSVKADKADLVIGQGLANRLGLPTYPPNKRKDIYRVMSEKGMKLSDVYTIPEDDNFRYGADNHVSRVCSCLAMDILRASGAFEGTSFDVEFNAAEQTPKDIFAFKLWDITSPLPAGCKANDPELPYCQVWGNYKIQFDERTLNANDFCDHMSETCPTKAPLYERPDKC